MISNENTIVRAGRTLAAERRRRGLTIEKISGLTGLSPQVISNTDNGVVQKPRFEIVKYGSVLGYDANQLAVLFDFLSPQTDVRDVRFTRLENLVNLLPEEEKENILKFIDNYVATVQRSINEKEAQNNGGI